MTEPGYVAPAKPGWWVRTDRVGVGATDVEWVTSAAGEKPFIAYGHPTRIANPNVGPMALRNKWRPRPKSRTRRLIPGFDSVSAQVPGLSTSWSYSHTATAGAYVALCLVADRAVTLSNVQYDGAAMTLLGSQNLNNNGPSGALYMYGIANVPSGSKTVSGTITSSFFTVNTIGFVNISSVGTPSAVYGTGSSLSQGPVTCGGAQIVVQVFGTGASATTYTSLSGGTNKLNTTANGSTMAINIATTDTTYTCTGAAQPWAGLATVLSGG